ncbi:unnamed protein product, partial [Ectocarpus sp. 12 AP-2014]
ARREGGCSFCISTPESVQVHAQNKCQLIAAFGHTTFSGSVTAFCSCLTAIWVSEAFAHITRSTFTSIELCDIWHRCLPCRPLQCSDEFFPRHGLRMQKLPIKAW